jgi:hypothetical protein
MRGVLLAMLVAAGIGLAGSAGVSAAPVNGAVIGEAATAASPVEQVQHWRWGSRGGHYRWGSRGGHWRWGSRGVRRCHRIYSSRWVPCW